MSKKISVITPCYNDGDTLELHIETFLEQDYDNKELILIDDGSKDGSATIIRKYEKKNPGLVRGIYFPKNQGACKARNEGAKAATGDVYSFLPADSFIFPGTLTTWMTELGRNPDVAFIYGGYYFVDNQIKKPSWLGGRVEMPYHSQDFDVRELKTANYIDGSFPIRKEAFWGAAKRVGLKDGLWNAQVKSLQDWDFWLSVVIEYGAKGKFYPLHFMKSFETTMPHSGGLSDDSNRNWLARVKHIQALHGIQPSPLCVTSPYAPLHGQNVAKLLDADFKEHPAVKQHDYKAIYMIGFPCYNLEALKAFFSSPAYLQQAQVLQAMGKWDGTYPMSNAKRLVHFIGSDILTLNTLSPIQLSKVREFLASCGGVFAELPATQKELKRYGIESDIVPFPPRKWFDIAPLPKKKAVAVYMPKDNDAFYFKILFYGYGKMKGLVQRMPDVTFHFFGDSLATPPAKAKNYKLWGFVNDVEPIIQATNAIVRITRHDGLPISVAEWIGAGRNAVTTVQMPFADHFDMKKFVKGKNVEMDTLMDDLQKMVYSALDKPLNTRGAAHYRKWLDAEKFKKTIDKFVHYDEKHYWEHRAVSWDAQAGRDIVETKKLKSILSGIKFSSVVDVGCGNGRFVSYFDGKEYVGCDISNKLVNICKKAYPDHRFFTCPVEKLDLEGEKADLAFVYTVLEHVKPENIADAVDSLKRVAKQILLIEPKDFIPTGDYCYPHDYPSLFRVVQKWSLGDKWAYLIKT